MPTESRDTARVTPVPGEPGQPGPEGNPRAGAGQGRRSWDDRDGAGAAKGKLWVLFSVRNLCLSFPTVLRTHVPLGESFGELGGGTPGTLGAPKPQHYRGGAAALALSITQPVAAAVWGGDPQIPHRVPAPGPWGAQVLWKMGSGSARGRSPREGRLTWASVCPGRSQRRPGPGDRVALAFGRGARCAGSASRAGELGSALSRAHCLPAAPSRWGPRSAPRPTRARTRTFIFNK